MTFGFTEDQNELRSTAARFLEEKSGFGEGPRADGNARRFRRGDLEADGRPRLAGPRISRRSTAAIGFGFVELTVLMEEMGKKLVCAPFFSSVVLGSNAILNAGTEDQKKELLPGIADGTTRAALAFVEPNGKWELEGIELQATESGGNWTLSGDKSYVVDGHTANLLIVAAKTGDGISLFTVDPDAEGVTRTPLQTLDMTRKQAKISFANTPAKLLGEQGKGGDALTKTLDQAAAALSAEMVGGSQACLDASTHVREGALPVRTSDRFVPSDQAQVREHAHGGRDGTLGRVLRGLGRCRRP